MLQVRTICRPCRRRILATFHARHGRSSSSFSIIESPVNPSGTFGTEHRCSRLRPSQALYTCTPRRFLSQIGRDESSSTGQEQNEHAEQRVEEDDENIGSPTEEIPQPPSEPESIEFDRTLLDPEQVAQYARQRFGDRLPQDALTEREYRVYERMYGKPLNWTEEIEMEGQYGEDASTAEQEDDHKGNGILKEDADGTLREVDFIEEDDILEGLEEEDGAISADEHLQLDIASTMEGRDAEDFPDESLEDGEQLRTHPFTLDARFGTDPSTIFIPKDVMTDPVSTMISTSSNSHLDAIASKTFGGPGLPYATATPLSSRQMPQKPIPMLASHHRMTSIQADIFTIALWPGMYSSVMSVLVEIRKRMGSAWLESLFQQPDGPRVLDAGAGGAGVMAWREILKAEWARMHSDTFNLPQVPLGKATVVTGATTLRHRASAVLENTTFLPRLPDYLHVSDHSETAQRKQFDIIIAPHTLWPIDKEYLRRQHVDNLWTMLNPSGGILILLEKGVPRGFETVAGAREHILRNLFTNSPLSTSENMSESMETDADADFDTENPRPLLRRDTGAILAPCTTHAKCPMYTVPGVSKQRKDYCHFSQRYIRPPYLQRMLGARSRNHEDVPFSYLAIQRGILPTQLGLATSSGTSTNPDGRAATTRAFTGYDIDDDDLPPSQGPNPFNLPRLVFPPLKRHGHVLLDLCTPAGTLERWTVPRSYGKQAYRDARKAAWGDLWAIGAKQRVARRVRLGKPASSSTKRNDPEDEDDIDIPDNNNSGSALKEGEFEYEGILENSEGEQQQTISRPRVSSKPRKEDSARGRLKAKIRKRAMRRGGNTSEDDE